MKNFYLFFLLLPFSVFAQTKSIEMTNGKGRVETVVENKRVRIVTQDGETHYGRVKFLDDDHIILRKDTIAFSSITKIQKRSLAKAVISGAVIGLSVITVSVGYILVATATDGAGIVIGCGYGAAITGIVLSPFSKTYTTKHWKFAVVTQQKTLTFQ